MKELEFKVISNEINKDAGYAEVTSAVDAGRHRVLVKTETFVYRDGRVVSMNTSMVELTAAQLKIKWIDEGDGIDKEVYYIDFIY